MRVGDQIAGRYRLLRPIASGGMGEVWAARNELTRRDFAIKFLLPEFAQNADAFNRFVREAETTGRLQHPCIVDVFDVAMSEDGRPFIVMELLSGEELDTLLERVGSLSPLLTAVYFSRVAFALALAHRAGVIHRDLSSANIFLARVADQRQPVPKILDFGISKTTGPELDDRVQTSRGAVLGSPAYMSPEQAMGAEAVDARTDVWALGVLMYQCLTGTTPFRSRNYNALMVDIMVRPHRPLLELVPAVDRELVSVIEACLIKDRDRRLGSAVALSEKLSAIARRLSADSRELRGRPTRRATDCLPPPTREALASRATEAARELAPAGVPFSVRAWRRFRSLEPRRSVVLALGVVCGIAPTLWLTGSPAASPAPHTDAEALRAAVVSAPLDCAPEPATVHPVSLEAPPTGSLPIETDLARAVAKSLRVKSR